MKPVPVLGPGLGEWAGEAVRAGEKTGENWRESGAPGSSERNEEREFRVRLARLSEEGTGAGRAWRVRREEEDIGALSD